MAEADSLTLLTAYGFEKLTQWVALKQKMKLESLAWPENAGWLYAFVTANRVRYVGITTMVLRSRMDSYRDLRNDRVRALIRSCLERNEIVEIYGLRRPKTSPIDLEQEESMLIRTLETDWNVRR